MKRQSIIIITSVFILILILYYNYDNNKTVLVNKNIYETSDSNVLTMMYEQEQNGEYQASSDISWPKTGYTFNEKLSRCENGSTLIWDNVTKKILMKANTSDKCYVYFDKYKISVINKTITSSTHNSITINIEATPGDGAIVSYHYSINNGEYVISNNNSYTFDNLISNTSYNIKVYITDSNGVISNVYSTSETTKIGLINFSINSTTYYAKPDMTWNEWVVSEYNTDKNVIGCAGNTLYYLVSGSFDGGGGYPISAYTSCDSKISTDGNYYHATSGPPDRW